VKTLKILVSEDEKTTSDTYFIFLQAEGHECLVTSDGQECIDVYKKEIAKDPRQGFDLVLLDYMIPKKNGGEVAKEILAINPNQKILIATAYLAEVLNRNGLKFEKNLRIIFKPFQLEDMMRVINNMVGHA
jgi:DNA-binding response OmpR family regulator